MLRYVQLNYVEQQEPKSAEEFHIKSQARTHLYSNGCRRRLAAQSLADAAWCVAFLFLRAKIFGFHTRLNKNLREG